VGDGAVRDGQQAGEVHQPGATQREAGDDGTDPRGDVQQWLEMVALENWSCLSVKSARSRWQKDVESLIKAV
jgi:hypothetical protein